ncbi:MAG: hypothetical protein RLZZ507_2855 [Cyanobacteriota bacterium]
MKIRKILLVDLCLLGEKGGGHSEFYFMNILSILSNHNDIVYACCSNNKTLRENIERENLKNCQVIDIDVTLSDKIIRRLLLLLDTFIPKIPGMTYLRFSSLINLTIVKRLIANLGEEIPVFFPHTDSMMPAVPTFISRFFLPKKWAGLHILPSYQLAITDGREKSRKRFYAEKNFLLPSCQAILVLHPLYQRFLAKRFKGLTSFYLPELVSINPTVKNHNYINTELLLYIKENSKGRKIISILGNLTPRKNLPLFLESVSKLSSEKYFVLVLGKIKIPQSITLDPEMDRIEDWMKMLNHNSYIDIDYYIKNEEEFSELIQLSDIVFCHYKSYPFSSSILTKTMAHHKPVIVDKGYLMEKIINKYNWKIAVEGEPNAIAQAIENLIDTDFQVKDSSYSSFIEDHSLESFQSVILQACKTLQDSTLNT